MRNGFLLATLYGHTGKVRSAEFNDQGDKIVTVSEDGTAKIWQQKVLSLKQQVILNGAVNFLRDHKEEMFRAARKLAAKEKMAFIDALTDILESYKTYPEESGKSSAPACCLS